MTVLPGQETLLASWAALAQQSSGARLVDTPAATAAVFPAWQPLNNAILLAPVNRDHAAAAAVDLVEIYRDAGVATWALWLPSGSTRFDGPDVAAVPGLVRCATTLVMTGLLRDDLQMHPAVRQTTAEAAARAGDAPIPLTSLPEPDRAQGVDGWVLVEDEHAVAGAWSHVHGTDVGIFAVGVVPERRRRGLGRALTQHVLGAARASGVRTASLQSTPEGEALYAGLGFTAVGRYEEWCRPSPTLVG